MHFVHMYVRSGAANPPSTSSHLGNKAITLGIWGPIRVDSLFFSGCEKLVSLVVRMADSFCSEVVCGLNPSSLKGVSESRSPQASQGVRQFNDPRMR
jgi:hypothetical protein